MRKYQTANLQPSTKLTPDEASWIYNGLDCAVTFEVMESLERDLAGEPDYVKQTYDTALAKITPILYMNIRGLKVNLQTLSKNIAKYEKDLAMLNRRWDKLCDAILGYPVNWQSPVQMNTLFYDIFQLKKVRKRNANGGFSPTTNAAALESFRVYFYIRPWVNLVLAMRNIKKKLGFLKTEIDADNRIRTQLNIAGTNTGRLNSKFAATGSGTNLQNIENRLRENFIPDDGYVFVNIDLEQADSRNLGATIWNIFLDTHGPEKAGAYLDACESGDLHTKVTAMCWRQLGWPEPWDTKAARLIADDIFYRHYTYRDMSKRLGHGTNFFGTSYTMAQHTKTEEPIISQFQGRYFNAFPLIGNVHHDLSKDDYHGWVQRELDTNGYLINLHGRRRHFFSRASDAQTLREAIAYIPQSSTGESLDRGWLQLWDAMPEALFSIPVHDSILFQVPYEGVNELVPQALKHLEYTIELAGGRLFTIPLEAKTGFNWADADKEAKENPLGLRKWTGKEERALPKYRTAFEELQHAKMRLRR